MTPSITDHSAISITLPIRIPASRALEREVWDFRNAQWFNLRADINDHDWHFLSTLSIDDAAEKFFSELRTLIERRIPTKIIKEDKSSWKWLTERGREAIKRKHAAEGQDDYLEN